VKEQEPDVIKLNLNIHVLAFLAIDKACLNKFMYILGHHQSNVITHFISQKNGALRVHV